MDEFGYVIRSSLARDAELWRRLLADPASLPLRGVVWVVVLAGLSEAAAQSVALVLNGSRSSSSFAARPSRPRGGAESAFGHERVTGGRD